MITGSQMLRKMRIMMMISLISKTNTMTMNSLTTMMTTKIMIMMMMMITKTMMIMKMMKTTITEEEAVQDKAVEISKETARADLLLAEAEVAPEVIPVPGQEVEALEADLVRDHQAEAGQEAEMELHDEALHQ